MSSPSNSPTRQTQGHPCFLQPVNNITTPNLNPAFHSLLEHLSIPIHPFISCIDGSVHSDFPETLLAYHLLTSDALDNLARHYHQVSPPVHGTSLYPNQIEAWIGTPDEVTTGLKTKRFRFGRFIGLQCCESPCFEPEPGLRDPVYRPELDANRKTLIFFFLFYFHPLSLD